MAQGQTRLGIWALGQKSKRESVDARTLGQEGTRLDLGARTLAIK